MAHLNISRRQFATFGAAVFILLAPAGALASEYLRAQDWQIGPLIRGRNYSVNMPARPSPHPEGFALSFPYPEWENGHVHYVTFPHGSLSGRRLIRMRYRIEAAPGVRFRHNLANEGATIALYFQRAGDDWSGKGPKEAYRWYAAGTVRLLEPGEFEIVAPFSGRWRAVSSSTTDPNDERGLRLNVSGFQDALENAHRVGFVIGGGDGLGHGAHATGPARLIVTDFSVE